MLERGVLWNSAGVEGRAWASSSVLFLVVTVFCVALEAVLLQVSIVK